MKRMRTAFAVVCALVMLTMGVPIQALAETDYDEASLQLSMDGPDSSEAVAVLPSTIEHITLSTSPDDEDLFASYVEQRFEAELPSAGLALETQAVGPSVLTGIDLTAYNLLKPQIAKVAAGSETSTVFKIAVSDLTDGKTTWTADELGVSSLFDGNAVSKEASEKVYEAISPNCSAVLDALSVDCPYELYWFDKTSEDLSISFPTLRATSAGGVEKLTAVGSVTIKMPVVQYYAAAAAYTVTTEHVDAVNAAIAKAKKIVDDNAGKSTYERMFAYKEAICGLASYNKAAAEASAAGTAVYGNPWQLVWVFDGDENTTVVCEGYSKAFQYLCDLSDFKNASCYTVTGTMTGGTGAGNHMWNIVMMPDGKNYLVDVTNSDTGSAGANGSLFVAPYKKAVVGGYSFATPSQDITYKYDGTTAGLYSTIDLKIADTAYNSANDLPEGGGGDDSASTEVAVPTAVTGLVYNGTVQVGVQPGKGYTLSGTTEEKDAGTYAATATLDEGYAWVGGGTDPQIIEWSIAKKPNQITMKATTAKATYSTVKKVIDKPVRVGNNKGKLSYSLVSSTKYFAVDKDYGTVYMAGKTPAGSYTIKVKASDAGNANHTASSDTMKVQITVGKASNTLATKTASATLLYKNLQTKARSFTPAVINKAGQGTTTYTLKSVTKTKFKKYFSVAQKTGRITVKMGLPKGTYKIVLSVKASGNSNYNASATKSATVTLSVK